MKEECFKIFNEKVGYDRKHTIELVMSIPGITNTLAETYYTAWRKSYMEKPGYMGPKKEKKETVKAHIKRDKKFKYIADPILLTSLKQTHTYKEIAKMFNTYPNKIYENIKYYKQTKVIKL